MSMSSILHHQNKVVHSNWFNCSDETKSCPKPALPIHNNISQNAGKMKYSKIINAASLGGHAKKQLSNCCNQNIYASNYVNIYFGREGTPGGFGAPLKNNFL